MRLGQGHVCRVSDSAYLPLKYLQLSRNMTNRSKFAPGVACDNSASIVNPIRETNAIHLSFLLDTGTVMRFAPTCLKGKSKMVAKYPRVAQFPSPAMWQTIFAPFQSSYRTPATSSPSTSLPIAVPRPATHVPPALSQTHGPTRLASKHSTTKARQSDTPRHSSYSERQRRCSAP